MSVKKGLFLAFAVVLLAVNFFHLFLIVQQASPTGKTVADDTGVVSLCINHPPSLDAISDQSAVAGAAFSLQANASDADGNNITYYDNTSLFAINSVTGAIAFTPTSAQAGTHALEITASDGTGCSNSNVSDSFVLVITAASGGTGSSSSGGGGGGGGGGSSAGRASASILPQEPAVCGDGVCDPAERCATSSRAGSDSEGCFNDCGLCTYDETGKDDIDERPEREEAASELTKPEERQPLAGRAIFSRVSSGLSVAAQTVAARKIYIAVGLGIIGFLGAVAVYLYISLWNPYFWRGFWKKP